MGRFMEVEEGFYQKIYNFLEKFEQFQDACMKEFEKRLQNSVTQKGSTSIGLESILVAVMKNFFKESEVWQGQKYRAQLVDLKGEVCFFESKMKEHHLQQEQWEANYHRPEEEHLNLRQNIQDVEVLRNKIQQLEHSLQLQKVQFKDLEEKQEDEFVSKIRNKNSGFAQKRAHDYRRKYSTDDLLALRSQQECKESFGSNNTRLLSLKHGNKVGSFVPMDRYQMIWVQFKFEHSCIVCASCGKSGHSRKIYQNKNQSIHGGSFWVLEQSNYEIKFRASRSFHGASQSQFMQQDCSHGKIPSKQPADPIFSAARAQKHRTTRENSHTIQNPTRHHLGGTSKNETIHGLGPRGAQLDNIQCIKVATHEHMSHPLLMVVGRS